VSDQMIAGLVVMGVMLVMGFVAGFFAGRVYQQEKSK
jgi:uncharacterized protein YneF (UPF0154 family)